MDLLDTIRAEIVEFSDSSELQLERNFILRKRALHSVSIVKATERHGSTHQAALSLENRILRINASIREKYLRQMRQGRATHAELREVFNRFTDYKAGDFGNSQYSEDDLDVFLDTLFGLDLDAVRIPSTREGMVHLERTPARVVLEFVDKLDLTERETVFDLGSGIGHMILVLGLLTNAKCIGIEIERSYCEAAMRVVEAWHMPNVSVVNDDVQVVDLRPGDVFLMYSPFFGKVLSRVLGELEQVAKKKTIRICSYGNSTMRLADVPWLRAEHRSDLGPHCAATFVSTSGH